jgi:hypothetical protein
MDRTFRRIRNFVKSSYATLAGRKYKLVVPGDNNNDIFEIYENEVYSSSDIESNAFYKHITNLKFIINPSDGCELTMDQFPDIITYRIISNLDNLISTSFLAKSLKWYAYGSNGNELYLKSAENFLDLSLSVMDILKYSEESFSEKHRVEFIINFTIAIVSILTIINYYLICLIIMYV